LAPNTSIYLQTTLADEALLAEGQYLLEEQILNKVNNSIQLIIIIMEQ
jgi:hypothetical protein